MVCCSRLDGCTHNHKPYYTHTLLRCTDIMHSKLPTMQNSALQCTTQAATPDRTVNVGFVNQWVVVAKHTARQHKYEQYFDILLLILQVRPSSCKKCPQAAEQSKERPRHKKRGPGGTVTSRACCSAHLACSCTAAAEICQFR